MTTTELSWQARAEKLESELSKAAALINAARDKSAISSVTCCQMRKELERAQLERAQLERDHYKNKVERCREILGAQANESICEAAERVQALLSETEKQFGHQWEAASDKLMALIYTHKDLQTAAAEMREALENALVICQCFADGQEASPGFMDNNENVIRIKDALAKVKALPA